jgi:hypothetical protein
MKRMSGDRLKSSVGVNWTVEWANGWRCAQLCLYSPSIVQYD